MFVKLYFLTWAVLLLIAGVLWLGGEFTVFTAMILGVGALTLVFSGLMGVLPSTFHRQDYPKRKLHLVEPKPLARLPFREGQYRSTTR